MAQIFPKQCQAFKVVLILARPPSMCSSPYRDVHILCPSRYPPYLGESLPLQRRFNCFCDNSDYDIMQVVLSLSWCCACGFSNVHWSNIPNVEGLCNLRNICVCGVLVNIKYLCMYIKATGFQKVY